MPSKYYLYRHIRLDTNQIFYIGIGTKNFRRKSDEYARAYTKSHRNRYWLNIVNKAGYKVEIIQESNDKLYIQNKEKELIAYYGIKQNGGLLCNLTEGGERNNRSKESIELFKKSLLKKERVKILQYDLNGNFITCYNGFGSLKNTVFSSSCVIKAIKGKLKKYKNFLWFYKDNFSLDLLKERLKIANSKTIAHNVKKIVAYKNNIIVNIFNSTKEASIQININRSSIKNCLRGYSKSSGGYNWKYF